MAGAVDTNTPSNDPFDHEQRFLLSRTEMRRFLEAIAPRAAVEIYDPERPISYTRTTYLDTNDLAYFSSPEGAPARRLRIREYAVAASVTDEPVLSGVAFIELKQHEGAARSKMRLSATPAEIARLIARHEVHQPSPEATAPWSAIALELSLPTMAPRVATWYRRLCLTAEGRRVRITLDENLTFCRPQPIGDAGTLAAPRGREIVAAFPARVLEVKHCGEMPVWLQPALAALEPADGFSKFQMGMTALGHGADGHDDRAGAGAVETVPFALSSFVAA
ncbi:MAG TPA: VTC domain-containing protein [Polyangia bacterium]